MFERARKRSVPDDQKMEVPSSMPAKCGGDFFGDLAGTDQVAGAQRNRGYAGVAATAVLFAERGQVDVLGQHDIQPPFLVQVPFLIEVCREGHRVGLDRAIDLRTVGSDHAVSRFS